jgi:hypothetical protein
MKAHIVTHNLRVFSHTFDHVVNGNTLIFYIYTCNIFILYLCIYYIKKNIFFPLLMVTCMYVCMYVCMQRYSLLLKVHEVHMNTFLKHTKGAQYSHQ